MLYEFLISLRESRDETESGPEFPSCSLHWWDVIKVHDRCSYWRLKRIFNGANGI